MDSFALDEEVVDLLAPVRHGEDGRAGRDLIRIVDDDVTIIERHEDGAAGNGARYDDRTAGRSRMRGAVSRRLLDIPADLRSFCGTSIHDENCAENDEATTH